ncbi:MAG: peptidoglycan-binding domain-containing protein [Janthinobacterium lividum]
MGEDDHPVSNVALELQGAGALHGVTCADGLTRFEGLVKASYELCPTELDQEAWEFVSSVPLPAQEVMTPGPAPWEAATPPLTDADGTEHTIVAGENTDRLALKHGLFAETVWSHQRNHALHAQRESRNVLYPGDMLYLPPITRKQLTVETGQRYTLRRKGVPSTLRLRLLDDYRPLANVAWVLEVEGALTLQGITANDGVVEVYVAATASTGMLRFLCRGQQQNVTVNLRTLVPPRETDGWRQRLRNLALPCGEVAADPNALSAADVAALKRFQESWGLPITGKPDDDTLRKLLLVHDSTAGEAPTQGLYAD